MVKAMRYENGKAIAGQVDAPFKVNWSDWIEMTDTQKKGKKWLIENVPGAEGEIDADLFTELWRNPSPTSSFAAQNITLASDDYDFLLIINSENNAAITEKGANCLLYRASNSASTYVNTYERNMIYVSDTVYSVRDGILQNSGQTRITNNGCCVPQVIYGFKKTFKIKFDALAENVRATIDYSTEEHPIGTYNGQTLYARSFFPSISCTANTNTTILDFSGMNISKIVTLKGHVGNESMQMQMPFPSHYIYTYITGSTIKLTQSATSASVICDFIYIEYTKTS